MKKKSNNEILQKSRINIQRVIIHIYIYIFIFPRNIRMRMGNELIAWRDGSWRKNRVE